MTKEERVARWVDVFKGVGLSAQELLDRENDKIVVAFVGSFAIYDKEYKYEGDEPIGVEPRYIFYIPSPEYWVKNPDQEYEPLTIWEDDKEFLEITKALEDASA